MWGRARDHPRGGGPGVPFTDHTGHKLDQDAPAPRLNDHAACPDLGGPAQKMYAHCAVLSFCVFAHPITSLLPLSSRQL